MGETGDKRRPTLPFLHTATSVEPAMSDEPRAIVERFYAEVINGGDFHALDELVADDFVEHGAAPAAPGREGLKAFLGSLGAGLSDLRWETHDLIAETVVASGGPACDARSVAVQLVPLPLWR